MHDEAYVINLYKYIYFQILWVDIYVKNYATRAVPDEVTYFDNLCLEHNRIEIKNLIVNRNVIANFLRLQAYV